MFSFVWDSYLFVHQNAPDMLAELYIMTQATAKVKNCEDQYNIFNQVIIFDDISLS